jgi:glutaminase
MFDLCLLNIKRAWLRDIDLNIADYDGRTPLHLAAAEGQFECVHFLLYTVQVYPNPRDRFAFHSITKITNNML